VLLTFGVSATVRCLERAIIIVVDSKRRLDCIAVTSLRSRLTRMHDPWPDKSLIQRGNRGSGRKKPPVDFAEHDGLKGTGEQPSSSFFLHHPGKPKQEPA
jgi:hypothetical protein